MKRPKRREWVKAWLLNRFAKGAYSSIITKLRLQDTENYRKKVFANGNSNFCVKTSSHAELQFTGNSAASSKFGVLIGGTL